MIPHTDTRPDTTTNSHAQLTPHNTPTSNAFKPTFSFASAFEKPFHTYAYAPSKPAGCDDEKAAR